MMINIEKNTKCSKCGAINQVEIVIKDNRTIQKCTKCPNQKLLSQLSKDWDKALIYSYHNADLEIF